MRPPVAGNIASCPKKLPYPKFPTLMMVGSVGPTRVGAKEKSNPTIWHVVGGNVRFRGSVSLGNKQRSQLADAQNRRLGALPEA